MRLPESCVPPDVSGIVHALRLEGSPLAEDAAGLIDALHSMADSSCREADSLRLALAAMERSRDMHARLSGIGAADAKAALDALAVYRAEVPRLTARRLGFTFGLCALAPLTDSEAGAVGPGGCWGFRP